MSKLLERKNVIKVKNFLKKVDKNIDLIVLNDTAKTAKDAAKSLNKEVGAIVKSLLFKNIITEQFYLCLISGDQYMSLEKLSNIVGNKTIKANANECKEITGFSIGGVSPFAHTQTPDKIFIDKNLHKFDVIYAAAGHPYVVF